MQRLTENKIILITRKTRLEELIQRFNTESQARFYIEHLGADFNDYRIEHETYKKRLDEARRILDRLGRTHIVDRSFVPNFIFGQSDTIVTLGQDGLVANVLKYLSIQPVVGVNPDPDRWEGTLLPFTIRDLSKVLPEVFKGRRPVQEVTMAKAALNTGLALYAVNDLFIGPKTHVSARYRIEIAGKAEDHSSSGVIVSTGLGSTGWFRSIVAGAAGIASSLSGHSISLQEKDRMAWSSEYLYFSVREPWPSKISSAAITFGKISSETPLKLLSYMPEYGVIFSDGIESDFIEFNSGTSATVTIADKRGHLVT